MGRGGSPGQSIGRGVFCLGQHEQAAGHGNCRKCDDNRCISCHVSLRRRVVLRGVADRDGPGTWSSPKSVPYNEHYPIYVRTFTGRVARQAPIRSLRAKGRTMYLLHISSRGKC